MLQCCFPTSSSSTCDDIDKASFSCQFSQKESHSCVCQLTATQYARLSGSTLQMSEHEAWAAASYCMHCQQDMPQNAGTPHCKWCPKLHIPKGKPGLQHPTIGSASGFCRTLEPLPRMVFQLASTQGQVRAAASCYVLWHTVTPLNPALPY